MNKIIKIIPIVILLFMTSGCSYRVVKNIENNDVDNPTVDIKNNVKIEATSVRVGTFYDGKNGFSVSIPSGNRSTCIWTYSAGSGRIPYSITTEAETATEKHTISVYGGEEDLKLSCVDDFGNQYAGVFPESDYKDAEYKGDVMNSENLPMDNSSWNW